MSYLPKLLSRPGMSRDMMYHGHYRDNNNNIVHKPRCLAMDIQQVQAGHRTAHGTSHVPGHPRMT